MPVSNVFTVTVLLFANLLQKEGFKINLRNPQVCEKFTITREWRPFGVPADATYTGIRYLGEKGVSSGTGIALEHWTHNYALGQQLPHHV